MEEEISQTKKPVPFGGVFLALIIMVMSIGGGAVGGVLGVGYALRQPELKKFFQATPLEFNKKVSITEDSSVVNVVKKASPAVVSIVISKDLNKYPGFSKEPFFFDPFFGFGRGQDAPQNNEPDIQQVGSGSGFFVTTDGLILTNKHVVEDEQASYTVVTNNKKVYEAKVVARDNFNDLAILKIDIENAPMLEMSDSDKLQVGQRVIAIGNSLGQYQNTVTSGIVSGIGRSITASGAGGSENLEGVIQTDAAINPGNSGGPLLNSLGQVIGINTAVDRGGQSVGFAIPANDANKSLLSYQRNGKITRAYLGVRYVMISEALAQKEGLPKKQGALIAKGQKSSDPAILPGSPAEKAGLKENDIILEVDSQVVDDANSLVGYLRKKNVGDAVDLKVFRNGKEMNIKVILEESK